MNRSVVLEDLERIADGSLPWREFEGKTVLISGANGFLPAYMVETLLYLNRERSTRPTKVIGLVRNRAKAVARFSDCSGSADLQLLIQDVCEPVSPDGPVDFVVHAASQASPKYFGQDPVGTLAANVLGTWRMLSVARDHRAQGFLFFSSAEVYGQVDSTRGPVREDGFGYLDPAQVRSCYAESKRMGETMATAWAHQYGVPAKIVRPFHTYGPGMALDDGRVFADFVSDVVNRRDIVMKSDGSAVRSYCYLADAVLGFFTVLLLGEVGRAYNIGNVGAEMSTLELANMLVQLFPDRGFKVIRQEQRSSGYLESPVSRICPDISLARQLGWEPATSPEEGFRRTVQSYL